MATITGLPFSFNIVVEDLKVFMLNKQFIIKSQFADVFSLVLKSPETFDRKKKRKKSKGKPKKVKRSTHKTQKGQSLVYVGDIDLLMAHMMQYPMEICLCDASNPEERVGSTLIPWNPAFIEYLVSLYQEPNPAPAVFSSDHNIFDEQTSKRMAVIRLKITLRLEEDVRWSQFRVLSESYPNTFVMIDDITFTCVNQPTTTIVNESPGIIKTIYKGGKQKKKSNKNRRSSKSDKNVIHEVQKSSDNDDHAIKIDRRLVGLVRSDTNIAYNKKINRNVFRCKSCTGIKQVDALDYIFGGVKSPFEKKIYTVGYVTDVTVDDPKSKTTSSASLRASNPSSKSSVVGGAVSSAVDSPDSLDPELTTSVKCDNVECEDKKERPHLEVPDNRVLLGLDSLSKHCCVTETVERKMEVIGTLQGKNGDPCYCACECTFGFERKTTYCKICGGYEKAGEDLDGKPHYLMPDPCPVYHKITRCKTGSTSGSETRKETRKRTKSPDLSDKDKDKKKGNNDRFKFNYGYKGIPPQIGHSECAMPCTGTMSNVPKYMGWLWTADNIPGLMFRPMWKPGAINKVVARKLRMARNPGEVIAKRRKTGGPKKRPLKRPLLVVHKKDGEYEVTMETMKAYSKPRAINQPPYEDKPVMTYTIGRTEAENLERKKRKERAMRRLEREQREFIQSAFRDMCKEICLKTYQQALGILPDAEDPECTCFPALPGPEHVDLDRSCPCSEGEDSIGSDTDSDEWILEFTPPNAYYDASYPAVKIKTGDKETQYSYLDYRVKLVDRFGNPVPRFFKGPDGKQQCSDLGGFWSPDHNWLEINVDGYIGPDGRWAPMQFIGPSGEQVDGEPGKFQTTNGNWLVVGVDGYVDCNNKWKFYRPRLTGKQQQTVKQKPAHGKRTLAKKVDKKTKSKESEPTFSCFGDATPVHLSKMGIVGHGPDKRLLNRILKAMIAKGMNVKIPQGTQVPRSPSRSRRRRAPSVIDSEKFQCHHPLPPRKGMLGHGYFMPKKFRSRAPKERIHDLEQQGKSLSAFHEPCFNSNMDHRRRPRRRDVVVKMNHDVVYK